MGAERLHVQDYKPYLSDKSIDKIVDEIVKRADIYNVDRIFEEIHCDNGFMIEVHISYDGFNYRRIKVDYLQVHLFDKNIDGYISDDDCVTYGYEISNKLSDKTYSMNNQEEEEYELEDQYS